MQIKHVKDRKENLAYSVYFFFRNRLGLSKVITFNEQYESFTQHRLSGVSNQHAQLQGLIKIVKYRVSLVELERITKALYILRRCEAVLHLSFRIQQHHVFSHVGSFFFTCYPDLSL